MAVTTHAALHVAAAPRSLTVAHDPADGQLVGHEPSIAASHASTGGSTTPSPQAGAQSASIRNVAPGRAAAVAGDSRRDGQVHAGGLAGAGREQPIVGARIAVGARARAGAGRPAAMATSHASPTWTTPSPHADEQSGSCAALQPAGQQPSEAPHAVISVDTQTAEQSAALPASAVCKQAAGEGGQIVGQAAVAGALAGRTSRPARRWRRRTPRGNRVSVAPVDPGRQQPSPEIGAFT